MSCKVLHVHVVYFYFVQVHAICLYTYMYITGNGDVLSFDKHRKETGVAGIMIARYMYCTLYVVLYEILC